MPEVHTAVFRCSRACYNSVYTVTFRWDEKKKYNQSKEASHFFETAARIFEDPNAITYLDRVVDDGTLALYWLRRRYRDPAGGAHYLGRKW